MSTTRKRGPFTLIPSDARALQRGRRRDDSVITHGVRTFKFRRTAGIRHIGGRRLGKGTRFTVSLNDGARRRRPMAEVDRARRIPTKRNNDGSLIEGWREGAPLRPQNGCICPALIRRSP